MAFMMVIIISLMQAVAGVILVVMIHIAGTVVGVQVVGMTQVAHMHKIKSIN